MTDRQPFLLRPAEAKDTDFLRELFVSSRERELAPLAAEIRDAVAHQQYRLHRSGIESEYPDARQLIVLAPPQSTVKTPVPIGMIVLAERPDVLWVIDMALRPDRRDMGFGTALLEHLMEECRLSGRIMRGSVTPYNPARRLYVRLGITEFDAGHGYISLEWRPK